MFKKITLITAFLATNLFSFAHAAEVSVSKLRINLENGQTTDFLNLNNQSETSKESFEVSVQKWSQQNNENGQPTDVLEKTDTMMISPKTLVVLPGKDKVVRLIVSKAEEAKKNYSYRIIINQLPNKEVGNQTNTVNLLFKISLPVFIYSEPIKTVSKMNLENKLINEAGKKFITLKNNDTQHIQISNLSYGEQKFGTSQYLLPGSSTKIELPNEVNFDTLDSEKNSLELVTDKGNMKIKK